MVSTVTNPASLLPVTGRNAHQADRAPHVPHVRRPHVCAHLPHHLQELLHRHGTHIALSAILSIIRRYFK